MEEGREEERKEMNDGGRLGRWGSGPVEHHHRVLEPKGLGVLQPAS